MIVKKHLNDGRLVLAVCDSGLLGKKFAEGNRQLDLTSSFYKGEEVDEKEIERLMKEAYMINLVGEKSVKLGIKSKLIDKDCVIVIAKIPHAQILMF